MEYYHDGILQWTLRLPPKVQSGFGGSSNALLCDTICDTDQDGLKDDIVVDRSLEGYKEGMYFKIVPNIWVLYYSWSYADPQRDIALRESIINATGKIDFWNPSYDPLDNHGLNGSNMVSWHVAIASNPNNIKNDTFQIIMSDDFPTHTWLALNLGLINLLTTRNNNIYPFLEYQLSTNTSIADRFYTIQGNGRVGEYDVQIVVKKPTSQWSIAWSFTVIF
jgi:hypothetical protein